MSPSSNEKSKLLYIPVVRPFGASRCRHRRRLWMSSGNGVGSGCTLSLRGGGGGAAALCNITGPTMQPTVLRCARVAVLIYSLQRRWPRPRETRWETRWCVCVCMQLDVRGRTIVSPVHNERV